MPHQVKAVRELSNGKILCGNPGSGKTYTALAYYEENEAPRDIIVITTARKRDDLDWETEAKDFGIFRTEENTKYGTITVDSWNNIGNYDVYEDLFFIFDEQRLVGSGAWVKSFLKIAKKNRWIMLSGTPGDNWLDYIPVFIANGHYKNRTEFKWEHVVYKPYMKYPVVDHYIAVNKLVRLKNDILVKMPYESHTTRVEHHVKVEHDKTLLKKVMDERWHVYEERPLKSVAELFSVMRRVVNSDASRIEALSKLLEKHPKVIVFYNFDYELEMLRGILSRERSLNSSYEDSSSTNGSSSGSRTGQTAVVSSPKIKENEQCQMNSDGMERPPSSKRSSVELLGTSTLESSRKGTRKRSSESALGNGTSTRLPSSPSSGTLAPVMTSSQSDPVLAASDSSVIDSSLGGPQTIEQGGNISASLEADPSLDTENSSSFVHFAEWNGHKHEPVPTGERWVYLVQYAAGSEAWNCIETDAIVFFSLSYSYKHFVQAKGRIDRLNTPFEVMHYYILMSEAAIDKAIWKNLTLKKSFNERDFVDAGAKKFPLNK